MDFARPAARFAASVQDSLGAIGPYPGHCHLLVSYENSERHNLAPAADLAGHRVGHLLHLRDQEQPVEEIAIIARIAKIAKIDLQITQLLNYPITKFFPGFPLRPWRPLR